MWRRQRWHWAVTSRSWWFVEHTLNSLTVRRRSSVSSSSSTSPLDSWSVTSVSRAAPSHLQPPSSSTSEKTSSSSPIPFCHRTSPVFHPSRHTAVQFLGEIFKPFDAHCCHMVRAATKHPVSDRVMPSFVIFDIRALWRSGLSVRVPGCQKLQTTA